MASMTDDDIRQALRSLKEFVAARFDTLETHLSGMENGWINAMRDNGARQGRVEERLLALEARVARLEDS
jgi:hypothetical protein